MVSVSWSCLRRNNSTGARLCEPHQVACSPRHPRIRTPLNQRSRCGSQTSQTRAPSENPNGIPSQSPRLPRNAATLGQHLRNPSTATRLRPIRSNLTQNLGHNLVEVVLILGGSPKVGAADQPWAERRNFVGVEIWPPTAVIRAQPFGPSPVFTARQKKWSQPRSRRP
jgi:hypothetical protein